MAFQFRTFFRTAYESVFYMKAPWTPVRVASSLVFFVGFPISQVVNRVALAMDYVLFPDFKDVKVKQPVFIIGNARSGTTFMHRLLSHDDERFSSLMLWDLILLPVWTKKLVLKIAEKDTQHGGHLADLLERVQARVLKDADSIHKLRLNQPEEDEGVMVHAWASAFYAVVFPVPVTGDFMYFDQMPTERRRSLMGWYKRSIQRHLFCHGGDKVQLLSKNPMFATKVASVIDAFPDARIIYMVRSPYDTVASVHNLVDKLWNVQLKLPQDAEPREELAKHCYFSYDYALEVLDRHNPDASIVVKYDDLISDPMAVVDAVYDKFGYEMSDRVRNKLDVVCKKAKNYKSQHKYTLEQYGFTREQVYKDARHIFERFDFDTGGVEKIADNAKEDSSAG